ncbi:MAG: amidohydrolase [Microthrixaceae bacterium]|nr:amidohydrolase [Microthrixaceae bacterium]
MSLLDPTTVSAAALEAGLDFAAFDCDNHYYEAPDAFTRHVPPEMRRRCVQWCEIDGRRYHVVGGQVSHAVKNPTFDPVAPAGALADFFRGNPDGMNPLEALSKDNAIALPRDFMDDRDARVRRIAGFGLEAIWLFPTLGMLYEELLAGDVEAITTTFGAFNRWVEEDWGFEYAETIFAAPYISLADVDWACGELRWALDRGARTIVMRPAAVPTSEGLKNPFEESFDPFWAQVNEAGVTVVIHAADSGRSGNGYLDRTFSASFDGGFKPSIAFFDIERAAEDWLLEAMFNRMFERFPNLRVASVENGSSFLPGLVAKLDSQHNKMMKAWWSEHPVDQFRRHVWINPFWEDRLEDIVAVMGPDRVIFGSDWPHIEGMPSPLDYVSELAGTDDHTRRRVLRDNVRELNQRCTNGVAEPTEPPDSGNDPAHL